MRSLRALRELAPDLDGAWNHAAGLLLPAVLLGLAFVGERGLLRLPPDARAVVGVLPLLVAVTGLALAWRFDRGLLLLGLALVLAVFVAERAVGLASDGHAARLTWAMVCAAAPLALLALAVADDPGVLAPWRDPRALVFAAPALLVGGALLAGHDGLLLLLAAPLGPLAGRSPIPSLGLLAFGAAAAVLGLRYARRPLEFSNLARVPRAPREERP